MYHTNTLSRFFSLNFRSAVVSPVVAVLLLISLNASAQVSSKTQNFLSGVIPTPITTTSYQVTSGTATTPGQGGYFDTNFNKGGIGAFGVQEPGNNSNTIPVVFATQVFQKGSTNNKLTFDLGQIGGTGFSNLNRVVVSITLNNLPIVAALTIVGPQGANGQIGPQFNIGTGATSTTAYPAQPPTPPATLPIARMGTLLDPSANAIGKYIINLPDFSARTTVAVTITITASDNKSTVLINNVTISSGSPLPVELTRFDAIAKDQSVNVSWATASEKNNDHFDVQRSTTGDAFETIGNVKGQGNSTTAHEYAFVDIRPLAGLSYYRLRQVDTDGSSDFSPVATVQSAAGQKAIAFPNPSTGTITLPALDGLINYRIYNNIGQTLLSGQAIGNEQFDITKIPRGTFFLELTSQSGRTTQRLMRE